MENKVVPVCRKSFAFSQTEPYLKWKRGLSPLFQAFFPLQPGFFLNQAAVFRQPQNPVLPLRQNGVLAVLFRFKGRHSDNPVSAIGKRLHFNK